MKTHGQLFGAIADFTNLLASARSAMRGKRFERPVGAFAANLEPELLRLGDELLAKTYTPGTYTTKIIHHPKRRMISAAPFRDRVVHHALCRVAMPHFERKMIHDLYSNREGKGTHAAIRRAQKFCRRYPFALKCDVVKYFASIDHTLLKKAIRKTIRCPDTLWLFDRIIDASNPQEPVCTVFPGDDLAASAQRRVGIPIGNLTSQWFANIYLNAFDHWVKEDLRCPGYVRYVDDFILFGEDKATLRKWLAALPQKLMQFRVRPNARKTRIFRSADGLGFLGQRIWPDKRRILRPNVVAARRRLRWNVRQYLREDLTREELTCRWRSWCGHAAQADAAGLVANLRKELIDDLGTVG